MRVAVIGSGVSGLTAAHVIARHHQVTLFEKDGHLGGHANTHVHTTADGRQIGLDTGFIVHNRATYPHLIRLFGELSVATQDSDMSFGVRCDGCGLEYAGARGLAGVIAQPSSLRSRRYLRMLAEVKRFHRHARRVLCDPAAEPLTMGQMLDQGRYSEYFRDHFVLPLTGAIWSCSPTQMRAFPARYLIRFFANHGMLTVKNSPTWRTVTGGSRIYVQRVADRLGDRVLPNTPVARVERDGRGVTVVAAGGAEHRFDKLVLATHADQALRLLADPTPDEVAVLGRFAYSVNETVLHTDPALLPRARGARASWNYLLDVCSTSQPDVHVTYHLNRLQALREPVDYCVTLNQTTRIARAAELSRVVYEHPVYTHEALAAQRRLPSLNDIRHTVFCGAYHGWGFHEDGCVSGLRAALALGCAW
ncbi:MAG: NAD(P)/FAD-dependent oxidoreductase [Gaiellales bacterium]